MLWLWEYNVTELCEPSITSCVTLNNQRMQPINPLTLLDKR